MAAGADIARGPPQMGFFPSIVTESWFYAGLLKATLYGSPLAPRCGQVARVSHRMGIEEN